MERAAKYFNRRRVGFTLGKSDAYLLERIKGEARALAAARPENNTLQDQACVAIGYAEAFGFYPAGNFPWDHVISRIDRMRRAIVLEEPRARRLAIRKKEAQSAPKPLPAPKPIEMPHAIRFAGRWVSRRWYNRQGGGLKSKAAPLARCGPW